MSVFTTLFLYNVACMLVSAAMWWPTGWCRKVQRNTTYKADAEQIGYVVLVMHVYWATLPVFSYLFADTMGPGLMAQQVVLSYAITHVCVTVWWLYYSEMRPLQSTLEDWTWNARWSSYELFKRAWQDRKDS